MECDILTDIEAHPDPDWRPPEDPADLAALRAARALRLPKGDFWVFGYGSLMWRPGFPALEKRPGRLPGFHRRYCVYSYYHRGSPRVPGLVFGLDRGGSCRGMAYRVAGKEGAAVMDFLYDRELVTAVYVPRWVKVATAEGLVRAATFTVDRRHQQYAGRLSDAQAVRVIRQGRGANGSSRDYLASMVGHLRAAGLPDSGLEGLLEEVDQAQRE